MRLLAADIGGTKTLLALAEGDASSLRILKQGRYDSSAFGSFEAMLKDFVADITGSAGLGIERACLAVAGPISADGESAAITNLAWGVSTRRVIRDFDIASAHLINDFQAQACGIEELKANDLIVLQQGRLRTRAPRIVLGAGTGLGVSQLVWRNEQYDALPSEGGHADFAPNGDLQRELLAWLGEKYGGHVSVERLLSGPGLVSIYRFLCLRHPHKVSATLERAMQEGDAAAAISAFALAADADGLAREALDVFVSIYGALAGSLALITLPYGGVYVAGGIAPRVIDAITAGLFIAAFNDKGRMSRLTAEIPVAVVMNPQTGLLGALHVARRAPPTHVINY